MRYSRLEAVVKEDEMAGNGTPMKKSFSVFDCDAHINDPVKIWEYVEPQYKELVRQAYWHDEKTALLNGRDTVVGGGGGDFYPSYNPICIAGPGMTKETLRKLLFTPLNDEQRDYLEHKGAYDPHERVKDLDLMGIDQVMIIPTMIVANFPFIENVDAAYALARAYNDWADDFCKEVPDRLFAAAWLPVQSPEHTAEEIRRTAQMGVRMGLIRPIDAQGNYPNAINPGLGTKKWDLVYRTMEETGMVCGMHTFPASGTVASGEKMFSPGELIDQSAHQIGMAQGLNSQTLGFIYEATTWLTQVLMSGFLDRYPKLAMTILESNSQWLVGALERLDRYFTLYANERKFPAKRLPSEAFYEQCFISFESDEAPTFRMWTSFEDIGIWASDAYHHDGADVWTAIREMDEVEVPEEVQAKLLGGNARRMYGIEPKTFVSEQLPITRPDWFPKEAEVEEFTRIQKDPKLAGEFLAKMMAAQHQPGMESSSATGGGY